MKNMLLPLLALLLCSQLWATNAPKYDRIVGFWNSSSGAELRLEYSGLPEEFVIVIQQGFRKEPLRYPAYWADNLHFTYVSKDGLIQGRYDPASDRIFVRNPSGTWKSVWTRRP